MRKIYSWFQERLEIQLITEDVTSKYVPPHVNIFYCIGGITFTCFLIQITTGFAITFYYRPSVIDAESATALRPPRLASDTPRHPLGWPDSLTML